MSLNNSDVFCKIFSTKMESPEFPHTHTCIVTSHSGTSRAGSSLHTVSLFRLNLHNLCWTFGRFVYLHCVLSVKSNIKHFTRYYTQVTFSPVSTKINTELRRVFIAPRRPHFKRRIWLTRCVCLHIPFNHEIKANRRRR